MKSCEMWNKSKIILDCAENKGFFVALPAKDKSNCCSIFMPPTSKKLREHIEFGLSVRPSVRHMHAISYESCMLGFEIS